MDGNNATIVSLYTNRTITVGVIYCIIYFARKLAESEKKFTRGHRFKFMFVYNLTRIIYFAMVVGKLFI